MGISITLILGHRFFSLLMGSIAIAFVELSVWTGLLFCNMKWHPVLKWGV
jgi:hypothetical protein